jgi:tripartite-type tricarboxylate transporter receptor subunit TctC
VPGFELSNTYSYFAPAGTPRGIVRAISQVVGQGMNEPGTIKRLAADGSEPAPPSTPEAYKARFDKDYVVLEQVIKKANIKIQ